MTPETRERLKGVSTATLTTVLFKRGLRNFKTAIPGQN